MLSIYLSFPLVEYIAPFAFNRILNLHTSKLKECVIVSEMLDLFEMLQSLKLACSEMQQAAGAWDMLLKQHVAASSALASLSPELAPELLAFIMLLMLVRSCLCVSLASISSRNHSCCMISN